MAGSRQSEEDEHEDEQQSKTANMRTYSQSSNAIKRVYTEDGDGDTSYGASAKQSGQKLKI